MSRKYSSIKTDLSTKTTTRDKIREEKNSIIQKYGPYTAHNMQLTEGIYTKDDQVNFDHYKLNRIKQLLSDYGYLHQGVKLLDIASLESMFAIEFALEGLDVTSIEGRKRNLEKGKFAAKVLGLENINFFLDDVNNINPQKYGTFDIILCMGILYHIKKEKYLDFLKNVAICCEDILIIDSFVSMHGGDYLRDGEIQYEGTIWREFEDSSTSQEKDRNVHATLTNNLSFSMTKNSLLKYLEMSGFTSVTEVHLPTQPKNPLDRITLVCKKANPVSLKVFPKFNHRLFFKSFIDTKGLGNRKTVHWNENIVKRMLRRIYRVIRFTFKKLWERF